MRSTADRLAQLIGHFLPGPLPVRLRAWDGSHAGPRDAPLVVLRSPDALRRLLWQPGELGLAEAYVTGDLEVDGDLAEALSRAGRTVRDRRAVRPGPAALAA
ncbi:SAM-dependent methyltransferase, partial [Streptomyces sp. NPDC004285]